MLLYFFSSVIQKDILADIFCFYFLKKDKINLKIVLTVKAFETYHKYCVYGVP